MENANIRNVKFRENKDKQRKFEAKILNFLKFQIPGDKVILEMSAFEMTSPEGARTNSENMRWRFL